MRSSSGKSARVFLDSYWNEVGGLAQTFQVWDLGLRILHQSYPLPRCDYGRTFDKLPGTLCSSAGL